MKKLMIAVAIVCAAAMSHAAQFAWGFSDTEIVNHEGGENFLEGGTALLYLGTVGFDSAKGWTFSEGATLLGTAGQNPDPYYNFGPLTAGPSSPANDAVLAAGGQAYTLILLEDSGINDLASYKGEGKYCYLETGVSEAGSYMAGEDPVYPATMKSMTSVGNGGATWTEATIAAVPEPTSGLLLLLGMAGLALKRKRA